MDDANADFGIFWGVDVDDGESRSGSGAEIFPRVEPRVVLYERGNADASALEFGRRERVESARRSCRYVPLRLARGASSVLKKVV